MLMLSLFSACFLAGVLDLTYSQVKVFL